MLPHFTSCMDTASSVAAIMATMLHTLKTYEALREGEGTRAITVSIARALVGLASAGVAFAASAHLLATRP